MKNPEAEVLPDLAQLEHEIRRLRVVERGAVEALREIALHPYGDSTSPPQKALAALARLGEHL